MSVGDYRKEKNEYKGERTVFSSLQCLGYSSISFVLLGICCVGILMYFDYKQYLLTRNIIWIRSHAESPSLANIMAIANSEGFLHSMLATLPGVASMVPCLASELGPCTSTLCPDAVYPQK